MVFKVLQKQDYFVLLGEWVESLYVYGGAMCLVDRTVTKKLLYFLKIDLFAYSFARQSERETGTFHLLVHSADACNSQDWTKPNLGT